MRQHHRRDRQPQRIEIGPQRLQQRQCLAVHRLGGEAIRHHQQQIGPARRHAEQQAAAVQRQSPPQIRTAQIGGAVNGLAVHRQRGPTGIVQIRRQPFALEWLMHRVARLGMGQAEAQQLVGRQTGAGAPQRDARIGKGAQRVPTVDVNRFAHVRSPCSASNSG